MAKETAAPRCAALIGPYLSGKTTLLEALLYASGATSRRGSVRDGNSVGDHAAEARARQMSTEINIAATSFLGDPWTILDCPGSVELLYEAQGALLASRCCGRGRRAGGRAGADDQLVAAVSRPAQDPAHDLHQQDGYRQRAGAGRAGGVAVGFGTAAGSAPGSVARAEFRNHRLCRPGQRARLPLPPGPALGPDQVAGRFLGPGTGDANRSDREAGRFRRRAARKAARGRRAGKGGDLSAPDPHLEPRPGRAGLCRLGAGRLGCAALVEGAAPRDAIAAGDRRAPRDRRRGRAPGPGDQDLSPAAYRQAVAGPRLARHDLRRQCSQRDPGRRAVAPGRRPAGEGAVRSGRRDRRADPHGGHPDRRGADPVGQGRPADAARTAAAGVRPRDPLPSGARTTSS